MDSMDLASKVNELIAALPEGSMVIVVCKEEGEEKEGMPAEEGMEMVSAEEHPTEPENSTVEQDKRSFEEAFWESFFQGTIRPATGGGGSGGGGGGVYVTEAA